MKPKTPQPNFRLLTPYEIEKLAEAIVRKMGARKDAILTTRQVAERLGLTESAVRARCCRGQIPCHKRHGVLYFSENELNDYYLTNDDKEDGNNDDEQ